MILSKGLSRLIPFQLWKITVRLLGWGEGRGGGRGGGEGEGGGGEEGGWRRGRNEVRAQDRIRRVVLGVVKNGKGFVVS